MAMTQNTDVCTLTVSSLFEAQARYSPHRTVIEWSGGLRSYAELNYRADCLAALFLEMGVFQGDRISLLARNVPEYLEVLIAAAKIGSIVCCLNGRMNEADIVHCIELTSPKILIYQEAFKGSIRIDKLNNLKFLVIGPSYEAALASVMPASFGLQIAGEEGLLILYTSGTTGRSKGALISHRAVIARTMVHAAELGAPKNDTFIAWTPLCHMGAIDPSIATLLNGGKVIIIDGFDPEQIVYFLKREKTHWLVLVPGMIDRFMDAVRGERENIKGVNMIGVMADLVPRHQIAEVTDLMQAPYFNSFGSTETGNPPASASFIEIGVVPDSLAKRQNTFCHLKLVDEEGREVLPGLPGEAAIKGPTLFSGYWMDTETNQKEFKGGWFHMGDVFCRNPNGTLDFVDRRKYLIKSGGENIYPAEIENVLLSDPSIQEAAVVKKADPKWGEVPIAFVVAKDKLLSTDHVLDLCKKNLASFKLPKEIHMISLGDFPRSATGKIQRQMLEQRASTEFSK